MARRQSGPASGGPDLANEGGAAGSFLSQGRNFVSEKNPCNLVEKGQIHK
jgi:hypothetical protein